MLNRVNDFKSFIGFITNGVDNEPGPEVKVYVDTIHLSFL